MIVILIILQVFGKFCKVFLKNESGTEIGNSLEFDFVVPPPHS